uniref:Uncharacterized protein n=1 Tax=Amphimedon queenslandica TaxID=400682 RepID=A0A1X7VVJ4_AMPQE
MTRIEAQWMTFCQASQTSDLCNKLMIILSSSLYTCLLSHSTLTCSVPHAPVSQQTKDGDDVYYHFGGAAICEMLHLRYRTLKTTCQTHKREQIAMEIDILQAINTNEKSAMPVYFQYQDKGNMYVTHSDFIPFFQNVDDVVKSVISQNGLEEHGDEIVKVSYYMYKVMRV